MVESGGGGRSTLYLQEASSLWIDWRMVLVLHLELKHGPTPYLGDKGNRTLNN